MTAPTWIDDEDDDLRVQPHVHRLFVGRLTGAIRCRLCALYVPQPEGMPDYKRATMGRWT